MTEPTNPNLPSVRDTADAGAASIGKAAAMTVGERGIQVQTFGDLWNVATLMHRAKMAPSSMDSVDKIAIAIQTGLEAGLTPMAAVRAMAVIDGKPTWMGKGALALVQRAGVLHKTPERRYVGTMIEGKSGLEAFPDDFGCEVTIHRKGDEPKQFLYTVADAKLAKLWDRKTRSGAPSPWSLYPKDMLYWRALGRGLDVTCSDVMLGVSLTEIAQDYSEEARFGQARDVNPRPPPAANPLPSRDPLLEKLEGAGSAAPAPEPKSPPTEVAPPPEKSREIAKGEAAEPAAAPAASETAETGDLFAQQAGCAHKHPDGTPAIEMRGNPFEDDEPVPTCVLCGVLF